MRWMHWNWLDRTWLPLLLVVVRLCWLWPWLALLQRILAPSHTASLLAPGWLIGLPMLSLTLSHLAPAHELPTPKAAAMPKTTMPTWARIGIAVAGALVITLALWWQLYRDEYPLWDWRWLRALGFSLIHWPLNEAPASGLILLALVYLWLRGMLDAAKPMAHDDIWGTILTGVAALVAYLLLAQALGQPLVVSLGNLVVLLFAAGMMALALSSLKITIGLDYALGLGQRRMARTPQTSRDWLASVTVVIGVLLGIGVGFALLVAPEQVAQLLAMVNRALGLVWWLIGLILVAISYVIFMAVYYILLFLQPLIERLMALLAAVELFMPLEQPEATPTPEVVPFSPEQIPDAYRWLALALFALAVLVIFALVLRKLQSAAAEPLDETRESILSVGLLQDQLSKWWHKLFGRLAGQLAAFFSLEGEAETRRLIRQSYQGLLMAASALGQAHLRGQTPTEFGDQLVGRLPPASEPLTTMTHRYNQARYAPDAPSQQDATEVQQAWQDVQQMVNAESSPDDETETR
jgi:hypothetical protein